MYVLVHCKPGPLNMATSTLGIHNITLKRQISDPDIITCTYINGTDFARLGSRYVHTKGGKKGRVIIPSLRKKCSITRSGNCLGR